MRRLFKPLCILFCLTGLPLAQARELTDATRSKVMIPDDPKRIVTLAPSLGELAADLLDDRMERIIGVSEYTDYPPALRKVVSVGSYAKFNIEKVMSLKPDLVLATLDGNSKDQVLHLKELRIPVVVVSTESMADVAESIRIVGQALGKTAAGEKMAEQFKSGLDKIRARAKGRVAKSVLLQVGDNPIIVAGGKSFLQEALQAVGAQNAYSSVSQSYPRPSREDVLQRNPDLIIVLALGGNTRDFQAMATEWRQFGFLKAVKTGNVHVLRLDSLLRPSLRLLEGLAELEKVIYG